jgi:hypothetical protein
MKLLRFLSAKKTKKKTDMMPLECLLENVIPLDILLHYVGTKQFRYFERERERVIHVGTRPKMIERVRKKNKQGIGMLNVSLQ